MFFESWSGLARVIISGVIAYAALIVLLRISGKRTLTKMNAFDLVVTVSLGSTLATVMVSKSVPIVEGVAALALLIALQFVITWLSVRFDTVKNAVKAEPTLVVRHGEFLDKALRQQRVTRAEVMAAVRDKGFSKIEDIAAVVLETDGTISVIDKSTPPHSPGILSTVPRVARSE